jgi:hypothetical protein
MPTYQARAIDPEMDARSSGLPAVALEGPEGVGKTSTAVPADTVTVRVHALAQQASAPLRRRVASRPCERGFARGLRRGRTTETAPAGDWLTQCWPRASAVPFVGWA